MDDEIVRILIATDNHLGYLEKDPVRGDDSFASFEECLSTARSKKVDFMLLAGDMFHENKPSRYTMHATIELLRKYCLGNDPVYTEILNEQSEIFKSSSSGTVNFEDPFQAISLPIYAIHGNHDDPSRECGRFDDSLAALDILSAANLLNYFGKADRIEDIEITPLLIRKGDTHVALYGLGAIRDERLNRMWNQKNVKFIRPSLEQGKDKFFNIFILHQNRDYGRGTKNCIHESMIPEWMDLVIWGNEHECIPTLVESLVGTYRIYQPGSSVVTSLCQGESLSNPKSMGFIEIRKTKEFRLSPLRFSQMRPFVYHEISLSSDEYNLDPNDAKIEEKIKKVLSKEINRMMIEARLESQRIEDDINNNNNNYTVLVVSNSSSSSLSTNTNIRGITRKYLIKHPQQVLLRLRVEHMGYNTIHAQRFGAQFLGQVSNPSEILLFAKQKARNNDCGRAVEGGSNNNNKHSHTTTHEGLQQILKEGVEEEINKIKIEDLVTDTLLTNNKQLTILPEIEMAKALDDFVVKRFIHAISGTVEEALKLMKNELANDASLAAVTTLEGPARIKTAIAEAALKVKKKTEEESRKGTRVFVVRNTSTDDGDDENGGGGGNNSDDDDEENERPRGRATNSSSTTVAGGRGRGRGGAGGRGATESGRGTTAAGRGGGGRQKQVAAKFSTASSSSGSPNSSRGSSSKPTATGEYASIFGNKSKPAATSSSSSSSSVMRRNVEELDDDDDNNDGNNNNDNIGGDADDVWGFGNNNGNNRVNSSSSNKNKTSSSSSTSVTASRDTDNITANACKSGRAATQKSKSYAQSDNEDDDEDFGGDNDEDDVEIIDDDDEEDDEEDSRRRNKSTKKGKNQGNTRNSNSHAANVSTSKATSTTNRGKSTSTPSSSRSAAANVSSTANKRSGRNSISRGNKNDNDSEDENRVVNRSNTTTANNSESKWQSSSVSKNNNNNKTSSQYQSDDDEVVFTRATNRNTNTSATTNNINKFTPMSIPLPSYLSKKRTLATDSASRNITAGGGGRDASSYTFDEENIEKKSRIVLTGWD